MQTVTTVSTSPRRSDARWGGPTPTRLRARKTGYEKSQMITVASGRPIPNDQPMIIASAKSKPSPARNSCQPPATSASSGGYTAK